jgi:hypothetical protein
MSAGGLPSMWHRLPALPCSSGRSSLRASGHSRIPRCRRCPAGQRLASAPQLHLPAGFHDDLVYSYWSIDGFRETVNGARGFDPDEYDRLRKTMAGFPDARSVSVLRELGVRMVVVHPERAVGTSLEDAATRPIAQLPLEREIVGGVVLYRLERH